MSHRSPERTSYAGKQRHDSRGEAFGHLSRLVAGGAAVFRLNVYRCRFCRCWHVGHRLKPKGKR